jgi:hypothetical protein
MSSGQGNAYFRFKVFFKISFYVIRKDQASIRQISCMRKTLAAIDRRHFQIICLLSFLCYGLLFLHWHADWLLYIICICGCIFFNYAAEACKQNKWLPLTGQSGFTCWGLSVLISALSLCLLLKTNHWYTGLVAALLTVLSKYILRVDGSHIFNPSAFGILSTILLTNDAWLSPGQWGSGAVICFSAITLGIIVVTSVQKLDASLVFLFVYGGLTCWRQVFELGWPPDHFIHSVSTGSLLLFSFFMISDPKTSPRHPQARIIWAIIIAAAAFYFAAFQWKYNTPIWMLVVCAPLVPLLNRIFKHTRFEWTQFLIHHSLFSKFKQSVMRTVTKKIAATLILISMISHEAAAFCGFYVSKADGTLKNKTSQVIIVHDGEKNVITMFNDFQGDPKDFAMVVPVPVVLKQSDIRVVDQKIFSTLNEYSKPRLVEYFDENPCFADVKRMLRGEAKGLALDDVIVNGYTAQRKDLGVKIEAKYLVGEYDILILSAKESSGLREWLTENGYKIPAGANEVLEPYIKSNLKFFVVKVNEQERKKLPGNFLRPIQLSFRSPKFMLPIRLGMANADGNQDMIVYAFTKKGRIECANYRTVELPTGNMVPLFVQNNFSNFYSNLFQHQWDMDGQSVALLEYAWDVSPSNYLKCDPCVATAPSTQDLVQSGVWWLERNWNDYDDDSQYEASRSDHVYFTRIHIRYNRNAFPQDLMFEETANTDNYQTRYVITHPAAGDFTCEAGKKYLQDLKARRKEELQTLTALTGKSYSDWDLVTSAEDKSLPADLSYKKVDSEALKPGKGGAAILFTALGVMALVSMVRSRKRKTPEA